jgi:hypothetical protein
MNQPAEKPARLYKYKNFDQQTLELLIADRLYFADPTTFNDPLDTRPSVNSDMNTADLESVLRRLVEQRIHAEMSAAARSIRYKGPKTVDHIRRLSEQHAERLIREIAYDATNTEFELDESHTYLLTHYLEDELLKRYDKGIVSLSEVVTCPLMWSHYGDQHKGICIGYSVPAARTIELWPVEYGGSRLVNASDVQKMLNGEIDARDRVDRAVLFRKAEPWRYESEWRLIGQRGAQSSCMELEEVVFGVRCGRTLSYTVVKALEGRTRAIKYYEMREVAGTFELEKCELDIDEELSIWPHRSLSDTEAFERMAKLEQSEIL